MAKEKRKCRLSTRTQMGETTNKENYHSKRAYKKAKARAKMAKASRKLNRRGK